MPTLLDLLEPSGHHGGTVTFHQSESTPWTDLWRRGEQCSGGIAALTDPGDRVAILMETGAECAALFVGALLAGCDVVSLPARPNGMTTDAYTARIARILDLVGARIVCGASQLTRVEAAAGRRPVRRYEQLACGVRVRDALPTLIQFSSGTTGDPKGVMMPLDRLATNAENSIASLGDLSGTTGVSWLPWTHDMGLVGALLTTWATNRHYRRSSYFIPTESFIRDLGSWPRSITETRASTSMGPAFALKLAALGLGDSVDLSSLSHVILGGERINPADLRTFCTTAEPYGFDPAALSPAYGMAENGVSVSIVRPGQMWQSRWFRVDWHDGLLRASSEGEPGAVELVSCGPPVGAVEVTVDPIGDTRAAPGDAVLGRIEIASPSLFAGYVGQPPVTGRFVTGDLGAVIDGEVWVLGRSDDVVVVHGENYVAIDLERTVATVHPGSVAVCSDPDQGGYAVVCEGDVDDATWGRITAALAGAWGVRPSRVGTVPPGGLPRTSSSKLQRRLVAHAVDTAGAWR